MLAKTYPNYPIRKMTQISERRQTRRGRIFPEISIPPEELAQRKAQRTEFGLRCRAVFEQIRPELIETYYNWFIAIEPDSQEYLIDSKLEGLIKKVQERYGDTNIQLTAFRLNESGSCGMI